jgi:restriction system protein
MQFKEAAYEILKQAGKALHYNEITDRALEAGLLDTVGETPHATMGSRMYTDTLRADSQFVRGAEKGTFALKLAGTPGIQQQVETLNHDLRKGLRKQLLKIHPQKFEELIRLLLEQMGFEEAETTPYSNDKGVDVRGILRSNTLSTVRIAIQAKRWIKNVPAVVVRDLRGSLQLANGEQGLIITPGDFTAEAKAEAQAPGKVPISLINGEKLVDLLIENQVGINLQQYTVPAIDTEYWTELLGVSLEEDHSKDELDQKTNVMFPLPIRGVHNNKTYMAQLMSMKGNIQLDGKEYLTASAAAKEVVTDWKEVNGWNFWQYQNPDTGKWEKIGRLR